MRTAVSIRKALIFLSFVWEFSASAGVREVLAQMEPASSDGEIFQDIDARELPTFQKKSPSPTYSSEPYDFGSDLRLQMTQDGFGGQIKLLQWAKPWLAVTQSLRYFENGGDERLFKQNYGLLLGLDLHPWKTAFLSPFLNLAGGWQRFAREDDLLPLDTFAMEAAAGLQLRLGSFVSIAVQWTETYLPDLKEVVYREQKEDPTHLATADVFFSVGLRTSL